MKLASLLAERLSCNPLAMVTSDILTHSYILKCRVNTINVSRYLRLKAIDDIILKLVDAWSKTLATTNDRSQISRDFIPHDTIIIVIILVYFGISDKDKVEMCVIAFL